jgi:hypothetical protein
MLPFDTTTMRSRRRSKPQPAKIADLGNLALYQTLAKPSLPKCHVAEPKPSNSALLEHWRRQYDQGHVLPCPFCGGVPASAPAKQVPHPTRDGIARQTFAGCKHSVNVRVQ